jgi:hypothetical protein
MAQQKAEAERGYELRGRKILHGHSYLSHAEALETVGRSE